MNEVNETGGARIGMANATWPFVTLLVTGQKLELNANLTGNLIFRPADIISIEPYTQFLSGGVKIKHRVPGYNAEVIFIPQGSANDLVKRIEQTGFLSNTDPISPELEKRISDAQLHGSFPVKRWAAVIIMAVWNVCLLINMWRFFTGKNGGNLMGPGAQIALGFMIVVGALLLTLEPFRRLVLKPGRSITDIRKSVFFIMFICGFILLVITVIQK